MKPTKIIAVTAGGAFYALPALAAEGGLPQFDTTLYPEQLFWLAVSFGLLYAMMRYVALSGVEQVQDKRKNVLDAEISAARSANEQAKSMGHEADKALADARANANATISAIKAEASKVAAEHQVAQNRQLTQKLRNAEADIARTRDAAIKDIDTAVSDLAAAIVENVAGVKVKA